MKVSMIGLGKLGLPVSCAMVQKGHEVYGYDIDRGKVERFRKGQCDYFEPNFEVVLSTCLATGLHLVNSVREAVQPAEIVFIAVPTPSLPSGAFDTGIVANTMRTVAEAMNSYKTVAIISTVLPGTVRGEMLPILEETRGDQFGLCYNAQFIAMGTVVRDMLNPEFVLIGELDERSGNALGAFYSRLTDAPILRMSIENAEIVKMIYNTYIGLKILFANTILEICDSIPGADSDIVSEAIAKGLDRLISSRYLKGGMGDGGPCHPRDQRALSFLAKQLSLSVDVFDFISKARDSQSERLADLVLREQRRTGLLIAVLGLTFKPGTNLTDDSPSLLLIEQLNRAGVRTWDPIIQPDPQPFGAYIYVLATRHDELRDFPFSPGSVIIDPWRMLNQAPEGCEWIPVGKS